MYINTLPARLINWFREQDELADCDFFEAFPASPAIRPVTGPAVTVGGDSVNVDALEQEAAQRVAVTSFVVRIHVPSKLGGNTCSDVAARLLDALLFGTGLNIGQVSSDSVKYVRNTDTIMLELRFAVRENIHQIYDWEPFG